MFPVEVISGPTVNLLCAVDYLLKDASLALERSQGGLDGL